jgi:formate hydrogenlyase transcriptional activator
MAALTAYEWPGNIRELRNLIERAMILSRGPVLGVPLAELQPSADAATAQPDAATLEAIEREHILRVLRASNWVIGGASACRARRSTTSCGSWASLAPAHNRCSA